jgi:hypothetical protein
LQAASAASPDISSPPKIHRVAALGRKLILQLPSLQRPPDDL